MATILPSASLAESWFAMLYSIRERKAIMEDGFIIAVKEKMQADGISKKELAEKCGYVEGLLDRILESRIPVRLDMAATIAAALGISLDAVCGIIIR